MMLMNVAIRASRRHRAEAVASFISRTAMLQEAPVAHLDTLLQSLICNESHHILAGDVATQDPTQLTVAEAHNIGDGITVIRRGHMVPTRAVAEVLDKYPVLRATALQCDWFVSIYLYIYLSMYI